jgi:hypothetical protein
MIADEEKISREEKEVETEVTSASARFLIIVLVIVLAGAGVFYFMLHSQKPLRPDEAAAVIQEMFAKQGPAAVRFSAGTVVPSTQEQPRDPHYLLLEKAGFVTLKKTTGGGTLVEVTPSGAKMFSGLPGFKKSANPDGTESYTVPLADRQLVAVGQITMTSPGTASVQYTWKWSPNPVGDDFEASGNLVQSFNNWDRAKLIEKYGADFYHGNPQKATIALARGPKGWRLAQE